MYLTHLFTVGYLLYQMEDAQNQRRLILQQFAGTGAMPWLPEGLEYRPMKGAFSKRLQKAERKNQQQQNDESPVSVKSSIKFL